MIFCSSHFDSHGSLYLYVLHIFPHSTVILCTLVSILSGQHCLHTGADFDIRLLHHSFLLETGRREERTTKGAGINHLAFVIIIQTGYRKKRWLLKI